MGEEQLEIDFSVVAKEVKKITKKRARTKASKLTNEEHALLEFKRILNKEAPKKLIRTNREYGNKYIPLQVVEQMLSALFTAYSIVIPFAPVLMEGQVLTVIHLKVLHPILKGEWITYSGLSCVPLIAAESQNMIWNHRNVPGGKGFAILNAAKEIGPLFRAEKDDFTDIMRPYFDKEKVDTEDEARANMKRRLLKMIEASKTTKSLKNKSKAIKELDDGEVITAYMSKKIELNRK